MNGSKNKKYFIIIILIIAIMALIGLFASIFKGKPKNIVLVPCAQDMKICDDGSTVGRGGAKCEFLACPIPINNDYRKTFIDDKTGLEFKYYSSFPENYIGVGDWPPKVEVTDGTNVCVEAKGSSSEPARVLKHLDNGRTYCVESKSEGTAGSIYNNFIYSTTKDDKLVTVKLSLRFIQCDNYSEPEKTACKNERKIFNLDGIVDSIVSSLKLN